jgi:DNA invertase Pin-like site-specific DNA recombinase
MRAVGYLRVSTEEQASSGLGLEAQRAAIVALAKRRELLLEEPIEADEGVSGAEPAERRPALTRALERVRRGYALLVAQPDRLGRDVTEAVRLLGELERRGVVLVCANGVSTEARDDTSWLLMMLLVVFAEFQLRQGRSRTRGALAAKRARGEAAGAVPFGFTKLESGALERDEDEQEVLALIRAWRAQGRGPKWIAKELRALGRKAKRGGEWGASSVRSVMKTDRRGQ